MNLYFFLKFTLLKLPSLNITSLELAVLVIVLPDHRFSTHDLLTILSLLKAAELLGICAWKLIIFMYVEYYRIKENLHDGDIQTLTFGYTFDGC